MISWSTSSVIFVSSAGLDITDVPFLYCLDGADFLLLVVVDFLVVDFLVDC